jgi:alpha-1,3-mannosyltransferase
MAVLSPTPFTKPYNTRFRRGNLAKGECAASECTLICSDFWKAGWGRVQVVPSVQVCPPSLPFGQWLMEVCI